MSIVNLNKRKTVSKVLPMLWLFFYKKHICVYCIICKMQNNEATKHYQLPNDEPDYICFRLTNNSDVTVVVKYQSVDFVENFSIELY